MKQNIKPFDKKSIHGVRKDTTPYKVVTAKSTAYGNLDRGQGITIADDGSSPSSVVAGTRIKGGEVTSWSLFDVNGKVLASFPVFYRSSAKLGKAVIGLAENRSALLDTTTGAIAEPVVALPGGSKTDQVRIELEDAHGRIWVFARGADGKAYYGIWKDLAQPQLTLTQPLAFWPEMISTAAGVLAKREGASRGCGLVVLRPDAAPECSPDEPLDVAFTGDEYLADRYWIVGDFNPQIFDTKTKLMQPLVPECTGTATTLTVLPAASRVLAGCADERGSVGFAVWSPDEISTSGALDKLGGSWQPSGIPSTDPIVALDQVIGKEQPFARWIDLSSSTIYTTPPVTPLLYGGYAGFPRRFLAQNPANAKELLLVDLEGGIVELIANDLVCPHELHTGYEGTDHAAIVCAKQTGVGYVPVAGSWSEIFDFKTRVRSRIANVAVDHVLADGRAFGLTLTTPMKVAVVAAP
ncbi:MAG: hypothetical protein H0T42_19065 [Deltaproteobacteria bacterium]|nr:hypothetical protein [Deltaproteobacteria bacterium]